MPAFESDAVEALREAARALAVRDEAVPATGVDDGTPATSQDVAALLDGLVLGLGHLERGASMGRHPAPSPRSGERPIPRTWPV
ncbi:hypothetical protein [Actinomycetospora flava]|uniref:Uncharacterized protein n=1 Tax=Actinomycetospora flava TaxID=3129232 RepID=A0ABU8M6H2_9PSEU